MSKFHLSNLGNNPPSSLSGGSSHISPLSTRLDLLIQKPITSTAKTLSQLHALENNKEEYFSNPNDFEHMTNDLRTIYTSWLKKQGAEFQQEENIFHHEKQLFLEKKNQMWNELKENMENAALKLKEDRRKTEADLQTSSKQNQTEKNDAQAKLEQEAVELDVEIESHRRKILLEREKFRLELEAYEKEKSKIDEINQNSTQVVEFNIGGTLLKTSRATISSQPSCYLDSLVNGVLPSQRDKKGRIFLDRDFPTFKKCINFLRNPEILPFANDQYESDSIVREAQFLNIHFFDKQQIYCLGGSNGESILQSVELFDANNNEWNAVSTLLTPRSHFAAQGLNSVGKIFCYGGSNFDYKALRDTEIFDVLRNEWFAGVSMISPRRNFASVSMDDRLFALGGYNGNNIIDNAEFYDYRMRTWTSLPPLLNVRSAPMCVAAESGIVLLGGTRGDRLRTIDFFDFRANKWYNNKYPSMIYIRSAGCANVIQNRIYALGGIDNTDTVQNSVEFFDDKNNIWNFSASMHCERMDFAACNFDEHIFVSGGHSSNSPLSSTEIFDAQENKWIETANLSIPRYAHQMVAINI